MLDADCCDPSNACDVDVPSTGLNIDWSEVDGPAPSVEGPRTVEAVLGNSSEGELACFGGGNPNCRVGCKSGDCILAFPEEETTGRGLPSSEEDGPESEEGARGSGSDEGRVS